MRSLKISILHQCYYGDKIVRWEEDVARIGHWRPTRRWEDNVKINYFYLLEYNVVYLLKVNQRLRGNMPLPPSDIFLETRLTYNGLHGIIFQKI
jgi:hypothetical protein